MHPHHKAILVLIRKHSGRPTAHTFSDSYLGNSHPRFAINAPTMRTIARKWMRSHQDMDAATFSRLLTSLIKGESSTEKCMAGLLMDVSRPAQRSFDPNLFSDWLEQLEGWAEIDTVCTGRYVETEIPAQWNTWKRLLIDFSKSKNINKRRASLVLLCSPLRKRVEVRLLAQMFNNIRRLKKEREGMVTKAISWVLRCAAIHHAAAVKKYVDLNESSLPKIAIRETRTKLTTGTKTKRKK